MPESKHWKDLMRNVMIATPSYDGTVTAQYHTASIESIKLGLARNVNFVPVVVCYDALVQRARNDLFAMAYQSGASDMIWIDADMEWNPQWLFDLLYAPHDVVGGAVRKKSDEESYNVKAMLDQLVPDENGLMRVQGIGTGFLRLSRKAIEALWNGSSRYLHEGQERRWICEVELDGTDLVSEDILMCRKLAAAGFPIYLNPVITCSHIGTKQWHGSFLHWLARLRETSVASNAESNQVEAKQHEPASR